MAACLIISLTAFAQSIPSTLEWQKSFGGDSGEGPHALRATLDGGWIVVGSSGSDTSGNKSSPLRGGGDDFWAVKLDADGNREWDKSFGGSGYDLALDVISLPSGNYVMAGLSNSTNGHRVSASFPATTAYKGWMVWIDGDGALLQERSFPIRIDSLLSLPDGRVAVSGAVSSNFIMEELGPPYGAIDLWLATLSSQGDILWQRRYGGTNEQWGSFLRSTSDGGFILSATTSSDVSGNKTSPTFGDHDFWILRLDSLGNVVWDQTFGGTDFELLIDVIQTRDGGFILGGESNSGMNGNKTTPSLGNSDAWLLRLDSDGNRLWERSLGGTGEERLSSIVETLDGGFLIGAHSTSPMGGMKQSPQYGYNDIWMVRLDADGNLLWEQTFGGDSIDEFPRLRFAGDGGYVVACSSWASISGNKTAPSWGSTDFWVFKLRPDMVHLRPIRSPGGDPIISEGFRFQLSGPTNTYVLEVSTNLLEWVPFQTNLLMNNAVEVLDPYATSAPRRYYRARTQELN